VPGSGACIAGSGKKNGGKAAVAIAHNLLIIIWYVLRDGVEFQDLGPDYFTRPGSPATTRRKDQLVHELRALGDTVEVITAA
jgi:transposase